MMKSPKLSFVILTLSMITLNLNISRAQISHDSALFNTLKAKDSLLFEVGFNQCDLGQIEKVLPDKFEFYHDKNGITTSKAAFVKLLKENLCSSGKNITERVLEKESLEVFPLYEQGELYGAVQTGRHSFDNTTAQFTHLWLLENGEWRPSRIISYDHKVNEAAVIKDLAPIKLSPEDLLLYLGDYEFSPDFVLSVVKEGDQLYGDAQGQKVEINPVGNHQFLDKSHTMKLHFIVAENGNVMGLEMMGPNGSMSAQKSR